MQCCDRTFVTRSNFLKIFSIFRLIRKERKTVVSFLLRQIHSDLFSNWKRELNLRYRQEKEVNLYNRMTLGCQGSTKIRRKKKKKRSNWSTSSGFDKSQRENICFDDIRERSQSFAMFVDHTNIMLSICASLRCTDLVILMRKYNLVVSHVHYVQE